MASKRPHVIQGDTPGKPCEKAKNEDGQFTTSRKCLFGVSSDNISKCKPKPWSDAETAMLVQYICLHWEHAHTNNWPTMKTPKFWEGCAKAINTSCNSDRSGM